MVALLAMAAVAVACSSSDSASADVKLTGDAAKGQTVVNDMGCTTCHTSNGSKGAGPTFKGLAGSQVALDGGKKVTADAAYLHTAITDPGKQVVKGFNPIMPKRDLTDEQVSQIIAYLQAIGTSAP